MTMMSHPALTRGIVALRADASGDPKQIFAELQRSFDARMARRYAVFAGQMAERYDWSRYTDVVDVGGGNGTLMRRVLARHPGQPPDNRLTPGLGPRVKRLSGSGGQNRVGWSVPGRVVRTGSGGQNRGCQNRVARTGPGWPEPGARTGWPEPVLAVRTARTPYG